MGLAAAALEEEAAGEVEELANLFYGLDKDFLQSKIGIYGL